MVTGRFGLEVVCQSFLSCSVKKVTFATFFFLTERNVHKVFVLHS